MAISGFCDWWPLLLLLPEMGSFVIYLVTTKIVINKSADIWFNNNALKAKREPKIRDGDDMQILYIAIGGNEQKWSENRHILAIIKDIALKKYAS
jgi:hypothetical protein